MAVPREQFTATDCAVIGRLAGVFDSLLRRRDGTWMFRVRVEGEAQLPDGRRVTLSRLVTMPATQQIGRKARTE